MKRKILVVGAGLIGASVARHLARAGAAVTVIDAAGEPGGLATRASWAWINASWGNPEPYVRLRLAAMAEWRKLATALRGLALDWCGGVLWDLPPSELRQYAEQHAGWGYDVQLIGRDRIAALEPRLKRLPDLAAHVAGEGMLEPLQAASALLADAREAGAEVFPRTEARWLIEKHGAVAGVQTADGMLHADETVIAAGAATGTLLDTIGIRLRLDQPAGLLMHSEPLPRLLNGLVMSPGLHVRQTAEGRLVAGTDFAGADPADRPEEMSASLLQAVRDLIAGAERAACAFHTVGYRPTPADGFPAIGRPQGKAGLYTVVTHSGVTLGALLGRFAAEEILEGRRDPLLAPYHPDRPSLT